MSLTALAASFVTAMAIRIRVRNHNISSDQTIHIPAQHVMKVMIVMLPVRDRRMGRVRWMVNMVICPDCLVYSSSHLLMRQSLAW